MINVSGLPIYGIIVAVALTIAGGLYLKGRTDGEAKMRAIAQEQLVAQLKERSETDAEIDALDPAGICELLGGVLVDGVCE